MWAGTRRRPGGESQVISIQLILRRCIFAHTCCMHDQHGRGDDLNKSKIVFNFTLKDSARLWSGLTKSHFLDLDIQIFNVSVLFYWHAVSAHKCHSGGVMMRVVMVGWNSLMSLVNNTKLHFITDLMDDINKSSHTILLWVWLHPTSGQHNEEKDKHIGVWLTLALSLQQPFIKLWWGLH